MTSEDRIYRLYQRMHHSRFAGVRRLIHGYLRVVYACDIMLETKIGAGTRFPHNGLGVIIHPDVVIGQRCTICQSVTLGGRGGDEVPRLGDDVLVGANSVVLGCVQVGDRARIGAGSVVVADVPAAATVTGNPARVTDTFETS